MSAADFAPIDFTPPDALPPVRSMNGQVQQSRLTTTLEQRAAAIQHLLGLVDLDKRPAEIEGRIHWTRGDPTILRIRIRYETTSAGPIALEDRVTEMLESGAEVKDSFAVHYARLVQEVEELARDGML